MKIIFIALPDNKQKNIWQQKRNRLQNFSARIAKE